MEVRTRRHSDPHTLGKGCNALFRLIHRCTVDPSDIPAYKPLDAGFCTPPFPKLLSRFHFPSLDPVVLLVGAWAPQNPPPLHSHFPLFGTKSRVLQKLLGPPGGQ